MIVNFTAVYAYEINYDSYTFRFTNPPTYCVEEPNDSNLQYYEKGRLVSLAEEAVSNWQENLQSAESENKNYWKMPTKTIASGGTRVICDITISFIGGNQQVLENGHSILGTATIGGGKVTIYHQNVGFEKVFNVLLHEIGHSMGLGHYIADDDEVNERFYTSNTFAPSIMIPTTHYDPSLMKITSDDIEKVRSLYGSYGFYAFSGLTPPPPTKPVEPSPIPTPQPRPPIEPVRPFDYLKISEDEILVKKYETKTVKISGQIRDDVYHKGHPVFILIIKPDQTTEVHRIPVTGNGYFEIPLIFDSSYQYGNYYVEASYMEFTDISTNFIFSINSNVYEKYDSVPKYETPPKYESPKPKGTPDNNPSAHTVKSGDHVILSSGNDPNRFSITWKQVGGKTVKLMPSANVAEPTFQAPVVQKGNVEVLKFQYTIKSPSSDSMSFWATKEITVMPKEQPITKTIPPQDKPQPTDLERIDFGIEEIGKKSILVEEGTYIKFVGKISDKYGEISYNSVWLDDKKRNKKLLSGTTDQNGDFTYTWKSKIDDVGGHYTLRLVSSDRDNREIHSQYVSVTVVPVKVQESAESKQQEKKNESVKKSSCFLFWCW